MNVEKDLFKGKVIFILRDNDYSFMCNSEGLIAHGLDLRGFKNEC